MRWYAATPSRRTAQVVADLALLVWLVVCVWWAHAVDDRFEALADQVRQADSATSGLSSNLTEAGDLLDDVPLVGDDVRTPFDAAAGAADGLGRASLRSADTTERVGTWVSVVLFAVLFLPVAGQHVPRRVRFAREAARAERLARSASSADLLALRALLEVPGDRLVAVVPDAADGWRRRDPHVIAALVDLQLREAGVRPGAASRPPGTPAPGTGRG
jgi:hypothetical protein